MQSKIFNFLVIIITSIIVMRGINYLSEGLDASWAGYMAYALYHKLNWGYNLAYTYGLLNQVETHVYYSGYPWYLLINLFLFISFAYVCLRMSNLLNTVIVLLSLQLVAGAYFDSFIMLYFWVTCYYLLKNRQNKIDLLHLSILLSVAIIMHIKFTFFILGGIICIIFLVNKHYKNTCIIVATYLLIWLVLQHSFSNLPAYLINSFHIASGYTYAMQGNDKYYSIKILLSVFAILSGIYCLIYGYKQKMGKLPYFVFVLTTFFIYKESITRFDQHALFIVLYAVISTEVFCLIINNYLIQNKFKLIIIGGLLALSTINLLNVVTINLSPNGKRFIFNSKPNLLEPIKNKLVNQSMNERSIKDINSLYNFTHLNGMVDSYPAVMNSLITFNYRLNIMPTVQSFMTFDKFLLEKNQQHLLGANAPDYIYWSISPLDNLLPTNDDSLIWPIVLSNYQLTSLIQYNGYLLLKKKKDIHYTTNAYVLDNKIKINKVGFNQNISIGKSNTFRWVKINLHPTILEKLLALLLRPHQIYISFDNSNNQYRIILNNAKAGFIISPLIETTQDFSALFDKSGNIVSNLNNNNIKKPQSFWLKINSRLSPNWFYQIESVSVSDIKFNNLKQ